MLYLNLGWLVFSVFHLFLMKLLVFHLSFPSVMIVLTIQACSVTESEQHRLAGVSRTAMRRSEGHAGSSAQWGQEAVAAGGFPNCSPKSTVYRKQNWSPRRLWGFVQGYLAEPDLEYRTLTF